MTNMNFARRMSGGLKIAGLAAVMAASSVAHADIRLTPVERTGSASGPAQEIEPTVETAAPAKPVKAAKPKKVAAAKPCKKKGGLGLLGALKKTGLTNMLANQAVGGGMGGYAAGQVASVAVDEGAKAEESAGAKPKC